MQGRDLRTAASAPQLLLEKYEERKREYQHTGTQYAATGLQFTPMVVEAHGGGWSSLARGALDWVSRRVAAARGERPADASLRIAQRMSCTLHRENARAILRRAVVAAPTAPVSGWAAGIDAWQ